jgi:site-specific DNA recombinase
VTTAREYLRVSVDRSGRQRSNDEQRDDNRAHWSDFTWGDHYSDASSASRYSKRARDDWDQLVADLRAGAFGADVLVLWESSRGSRKVGQWVELIDLCDDRGVRIAVTTHGRIYDPANARDRRSLLEDAVDSEYESAKISGRVRRSLRQNATARRPHGKVLFGYRRIHDGRTGALLGQEPHPEQAPIVQRVFADYVGGRSARSITAALNAEGVRTNRGNGWTPLMVKRMLTNRAYLGHRLHKGEDFGQGWEPLIDADTFERVAARLEATAGRKFKRTSRLVSGLVRCGVCRSKMQIKDAGRYGCPGYHAYRRADQLDAFVTVQILERLSQPDVSEALTGREDPRVVDARDRARELRAELDDAMALWKAKRLSVQAYADMEADLLPKIEAAEREARRAVIPLAVDVPPAEQVPAWWDGLTPEVRREVVGALVAAVIVQPTGRGRRQIDWDATTAIVWRR